MHRGLLDWARARPLLAAALLLLGGPAALLATPLLLALLFWAAPIWLPAALACGVSFKGAKRVGAAPSRLQARLPRRMGSPVTQMHLHDFCRLSGICWETRRRRSTRRQPPPLVRAAWGWRQPCQACACALLTAAQAACRVPACRRASEPAG